MQKGSKLRKITPIILKEMPHDLENYESPSLMLYLLEASARAFSQMQDEQEKTLPKQGLN